jgi:protein-S-isoprenylcysteine O-methyltransferase Ste14
MTALQALISRKYYSYILVLTQFSLIGVLAINSNLRNSNILFIIIILLGINLGIWALIVMRKSKIRITPEVAKDAKLIKDGPYKFVRHPMYTAVLCASLGMLFSNPSIISLISYFLLMIILSIKISCEEKLLLQYFPDYKVYIKTTHKLIPFIY